MRVELEPCYGLGGSFDCTHIEVTDVESSPGLQPKLSTAC